MLPAEIWNEHNSVKRVADDSLDGTALAECAVATFVGNDPETASHHSADDRVNNPERPISCAEWDEAIGQPDAQDCEAQRHEEIGQGFGERSLEALLRYGVLNLLH